MGKWTTTNKKEFYYRDKDNKLDMALLIEVEDRKICRDDIEKVIEYLKEQKNEFEMGI